MGSDSSFLVWFHGSASLDAAAAALTSAGLSVDRDGDALVVRWGDGPEFVIGLSAAPHVIVEAAEAAERLDEPLLARCDQRFEVLIPDLEAALDEYNTLADIQVTLAEQVSGFVTNTWNGALVPVR